jgi:hypothetical protein
MRVGMPALPIRTIASPVGMRSLIPHNCLNLNENFGLCQWVAISFTTVLAESPCVRAARVNSRNQPD